VALASLHRRVRRSQRALSACGGKNGGTCHRARGRSELRTDELVQDRDALALGDGEVVPPIRAALHADQRAGADEDASDVGGAIREEVARVFIPCADAVPDAVDDPTLWPSCRPRSAAGTCCPGRSGASIRLDDGVRRSRPQGTGRAGTRRPRRCRGHRRRRAGQVAPPGRPGEDRTEVVRRVGLEPTRPFGQWCLRPSRQPIPPPPLSLHYSRCHGTR
jgi:hypothetical protein